MILEWSKDFGVGNATLDAHHRKIVGLINTLYNAVKNGREKETIPTIVKELEDYSNYHFFAEECLFEKTGYPACVAHKNFHQEFRTKLASIKKALETQQTLEGLELMEFLTSWFVNHILQNDMDIVSYISRSNSTLNDEHT